MWVLKAESASIKAELMPTTEECDILKKAVTTLPRYLGEVRVHGRSSR